MTDRELLERLLRLWERIAPGCEGRSELRKELIELLFAYRALGFEQAASMVRRARREYSREGLDAVSRYVLVQVEEELQRAAMGEGGRDGVADWGAGETPVN